MGCRVTSVERVPELAATARAAPGRAGLRRPGGGPGRRRQRRASRAGRPGRGSSSRPPRRACRTTLLGAAGRRRPAGHPGRGALRAGAGARGARRRPAADDAPRRLRLRPARRRGRVPLTGDGPSLDSRAGLRRRLDRYTRRAMTHVFVAPHPDDVALSCGGLIASLRELGQNVTILTVFSGNGAAAGLTTYQREALGFGSKAIWPTTEAFNRDEHRRRPAARRRSRRALPRRPGAGSTPPRPRPTRPPSASGSARRGTGARTSTTGRSPGSR